MKKREFTSSPDGLERLRLLFWLPVHIFLLPALLGIFVRQGALSGATANLIYYAVSMTVLAGMCIVFLRREFNTLCDNLLGCGLEILASYGLMLLCNMAVAMLLTYVVRLDGVNPNNAAIMSIADESYGKTKAIAVFMAPIAEELLFRAGIFSPLRKKNRFLAYAVSALLFSLYHVWPYAAANPASWIYVLQYIPASLLLARCYERTDCIWSSIFFHMLVNSVSLQALTLLEEMV